MHLIIILTGTCSLWMFYRSSGRPRVFIDMVEVELLRCLRFRWTKIAEMIGVGMMNVHARYHVTIALCTSVYVILIMATLLD